MKAHGPVALDVEDQSLFMSSKWSVGNHGYLCRGRIGAGKTKREPLLHRLIAMPPKGMVVDHINDDKLDNRRSNLRVCTSQQNTTRARQAYGVVAYRGVWFQKRLSRPFCAKIKVNRISVYLGSFSTAEQAARAYDKAALQFHGEYARFNFNNGVGL